MDGLTKTPGSLCLLLNERSEVIGADKILAKPEDFHVYLKSKVEGLSDNGRLPDY